MKKFLMILFLFGAIGAGVWFFLVKSHTEHSTEHVHEMAATEKEMYHCPMHPTYTSDRPGDCSICHMRLVPIKKEEKIVEPPVKKKAQLPKTTEEAKMLCLMHDCPMEKGGQACPMMVITGEEEEITCPSCRKKIEKKEAEAASMSQNPQGYVSVLISPEKQQLIGVRTEKVEVRPLTRVIRTVGRVAYDPELYQAQQEFLQAYEAWQKAEKAPAEIQKNSKQLVDSSRIRLRLLGMNDLLIEELKTAGKPDSSLLLSEEATTVWLYATIYEGEMALVKTDQEVTATSVSLPGKEFIGKISSVDSVLDPKTRSARVRARVENPEGLLKPEMYMNVTWKISLGEQLAVPEEAVLISGQTSIVFVDRGKGRFDPRQVKLGVAAQGYYAVLEGLSAGESIVTNGNFLIDSESRLKSALEGIGHQH